jgi:hypothetical protein
MCQYRIGLFASRFCKSFRSCDQFIDFIRKKPSRGLIRKPWNIMVRFQPAGDAVASAEGKRNRNLKALDCAPKANKSCKRFLRSVPEGMLGSPANSRESQLHRVMKDAKRSHSSTMYDHTNGSNKKFQRGHTLLNKHRREGKSAQAKQSLERQLCLM